MLCEDGDLDDLKRRNLAAEKKYDGTCVLIIKEDDRVTLQNRHGIDYTIRLPEIADAAEELPNDFKIHGEAVYINPNGEIEFTPCQRRCATRFPDPFFRTQYPLIHKAFDILEVDGKDLTDTLYMKRKLILRGLLKRGQTIQYVPYTMNLDKAWQEVTQREEEGLILKRLGSRYEHERSYSWLKVKNWRHDLYQVAGFTPGKNTRSIYFGSLVLVDKDGKFRGKVGSGFNDWELRKVKEVLSESASMPTAFDIGETWTAVKTDLRVRVKYYKITSAGVMRFPVFESIIYREYDLSL